LLTKALAQGFADVLNKVASAGYEPWAVNSPQSIFGKAFAPFGPKEGTNFIEYDLVYIRGDLLFWGARIGRVERWKRDATLDLARRSTSSASWWRARRRDRA